MYFIPLNPFYLIEISPSGIHVDISKAEPAAPVSSQLGLQLS